MAPHTDDYQADTACNIDDGTLPHITQFPSQKTLSERGRPAREIPCEGFVDNLRVSTSPHYCQCYDYGSDNYVFFLIN